ncbi:MAG: hypothetical protein E5X53_21155 [Mesorhizobium sp.]|nr:MAG: hypothetical protein E5X55_33405 [Mesorhizobium sp.]TIQ02767.1 MAG: hypothetical protein E5X57_32215 [Mesorhizobium sp.]TIR50056.1 MAG: hypothetical protein E5X53_21155 [Mesorhizobium sp.]TJV96023.1 MAG: hypothetical protein E5X52_21315 [Mesorhizobium sp.]
MIGYGGNDDYYVDSAGDRAVESSGQGQDRVWTSVSYALSAGLSIEVLGTTKDAGTTAINLTGNAFAQTIQGNAGANVINGGGGADTMTAMAATTSTMSTMPATGCSRPWVAAPTGCSLR